MISVPTKIAFVGVPFGLFIVGTLGPLLAKLVELVNVIPSVAVALERTENKVVVTEVYFPGTIEKPAALQIVAPVIPSTFAILEKPTTGFPATGPSSPIVSGVPVPGEVVGDPLNLTVSP